MTRSTRRFVVAASAVGLIVFAGIGSVVIFGMLLFPTVTVMMKRSPDRQHIAKLSRVKGFDAIFKITVDGRHVYSSPDFAPAPVDYREQLIWDKTSQVVVLEVAGRHIFGYHAVENRPLTDAELMEVQFTPFEELGFEGTLPQANKSGQQEVRAIASI